MPETITKVTTQKVDPEIARIAGPQLVCPVDNARFALNAANARWGSLLDAYYGTDALPGEREGPYNNERGRQVFDKAEQFLDETWPLERPRFAVSKARYSDVRKYSVVDKGGTTRLVCTLGDGTQLGLAKPDSFIGYNLTDAGELASILLVHNDLHCQIHIDPNDPIGSTHPAAMKDCVLESAVTTIMDCEDSVAAVDGADKARVRSMPSVSPAAVLHFGATFGMTPWLDMRRFTRTGPASCGATCKKLSEKTGGRSPVPSIRTSHLYRHMGTAPRLSRCQGAPCCSSETLVCTCTQMQSQPSMVRTSQRACWTQW